MSRQLCIVRSRASKAAVALFLDFAGHSRARASPARHIPSGAVSWEFPCFTRISTFFIPPVSHHSSCPRRATHCPQPAVHSSLPGLCRAHSTAFLVSRSRQLPHLPREPHLGASPPPVSPPRRAQPPSHGGRPRSAAFKSPSSMADRPRPPPRRRLARSPAASSSAQGGRAGLPLCTKDSHHRSVPWRSEAPLLPSAAVSHLRPRQTSRVLCRSGRSSCALDFASKPSLWSMRTLLEPPFPVL